MNETTFPITSPFSPVRGNVGADDAFSTSILENGVDGFVEGPNQEFDWPNVDDEFNEFAIKQLEGADTLLFGRVTYVGMAG